MKVAATIEARMTSSRLPGKVLMDAAGKPFLQHMIERLKQVESLDEIIIATTVNKTDDPIVEIAEKLGVKYFRGSEDDVLLRVLDAAKHFDVDVIVETTGDCPLIDPEIIDQCVRAYQGKDVDYLSNILERTYPIGMDTQVFGTQILQDVANRTDDPFDHEHVSVFIYKNPNLYSLANVGAPKNHHDPELRLTLDQQEDCDLLCKIFEHFANHTGTFSLDDILTFLKDNPTLRRLNDHVQHRNV